MMRVGALAAALMLLLPASTQAAPAPTPSVGRLLADKLDLAFRTCAIQLTNNAYLTSKNQKQLEAQGITFGSPPPDVQSMAGRLFGGSGIYAAVSAPHGNIWIAASATTPACKVTLADTELALSGRVDWISQLRSSTAWQYDKARSSGVGQIQRDFFVLNPDRPGAHMIMFIDGPHTVVNDGKGIQMIMTVALETAKAQ